MHPATSWLPAGFLALGTKRGVRTVITPVESRPVKFCSSVEVPE